MQNEEVKGRMIAKKTKKATKEELNMISRGIRPQWMSQEQFKELRRSVKIIEREYLKGKFLYISKRFFTSVDELTGAKEEKVEIYPPYRAPKKVLGKNGLR